MEAKDTVMGNEKKSELWKQAQKDGSNPYNEFTPDELMTELVAYHQAEISFKAGQENEYEEWVKAFMKAGILIADVATVGIAIEETKRAGIREVVEWTAREFGVDWSQEKKQLKKWGISNGS